jgi:Ca-activated chloride channel family protein
VRDRIEESDALIYSVAFTGGYSDLPTLEWMAGLSGGRMLPMAGAGPGDIAAKIGLELRNRYVLGFPANGIPRDGRYHKLRVQLMPPRNPPHTRLLSRGPV